VYLSQELLKRMSVNAMFSLCKCEDENMRWLFEIILGFVQYFLLEKSMDDFIKITRRQYYQFLWVDGQTQQKFQLAID
jgi:hypothetical protein